MEEKEKIKILQDLIQINSVNGNELEVAEYLHKLFAKSNLEAKIDDFGKIKVSSDNTEISKNCEWQRDMVHSFANALDTKTLVFNVQPSENNIPVSRILYHDTPIDTDNIVNNANKIIFEKPLCENILSTENSYCYNQNYDYQNELIIADAEAEKAKAK